MKKEELNSFAEKQKAYINAHKEFCNACVELMTNALSEIEGKSIDLSDCDDQPSMVYDGGRHPEYASNAYSMVNRIFINEHGKLCADIEDDDEYECNRWDASDITNLVDYVIACTKVDD